MNPEGMLAHIRHAEEWLRRARSACGRGEARQAVLRLLLAEAEIRRARESGEEGGGVLVGARPARSWWAVLGAIAAAGVVIAAYALAQPPAPGPIASRGVVRATPAAAGSTSILRFESGQVLPIVGFPTETRPDGSTAPGLAWSSEDQGLGGDDGSRAVTLEP